MFYIVLFIAAVIGALFLMSVNESMKQYAYAKRMAAVYGVSNECAQELMDCAVDYWAKKRKGLGVSYIELEDGVCFYHSTGVLTNSGEMYEHYDLYTDFSEYVRKQYDL